METAAKVQNGGPEQSITENITEQKVETPSTKPVNPLRLARPLEKGSSGPGMSKPGASPVRPMPMPTISPLCPPGKNSAVLDKNGALAPSDVQVSSVTSQPHKAITTPENTTIDAEKNQPKGRDNKSKKGVEGKHKTNPVLVPPKKSLSPIPSNAAPPKKEIPVVSGAKASNKSSPKKSSETLGPKVPVAEKTPRQTKRKKDIFDEESEETGEGKRLSKRARAPPAVYESPDPEMSQILKTIKKMETEKCDSKSTSEKEEPIEEEVELPQKSKVQSKRTKKRKISLSEESEEESEPEVLPKKKGRKPTNKNKNKPKTSTSKKGDPVFFKDEYMAVRNADDGFYICKAMQNIYLGSKKITIQWWSNEDSVIPAKDNPDGDIYAPDFYDKTEFETILTTVDLEKTLGKSKRMILPEEELERVNKILQRANDKAAGKLDDSNLLLTEDNPDGLDISLYKGEDQLDEIEKRRKDEEKDSKPKQKSEKAVQAPKKVVGKEKEEKTKAKAVEKREEGKMKKVEKKAAVDNFEKVDTEENVLNVIKRDENESKEKVPEETSIIETITSKEDDHMDEDPLKVDEVDNKDKEKENVELEKIPIKQKEQVVDKKQSQDKEPVKKKEQVHVQEDIQKEEEIINKKEVQQNKSILPKEQMELKEQEKPSKEAPVSTKVNVECGDGNIETESPVIKKSRGRPKGQLNKVHNSEDIFVPPKDDIGDANKNEDRATKRRAARVDHYDQFDFLDNYDDEVIPKPKKRKSQESVSQNDTVQNPDNIEAQVVAEEPLSTSERALLAEKARMEADANSTTEEDIESTHSDADQPVKKKGRKPKQKD